MPLISHLLAHKSGRGRGHNKLEGKMNAVRSRVSPPSAATFIGGPSRGFDGDSVVAHLLQLLTSSIAC